MIAPSSNNITQAFGYDPNYPLNNGNHLGVDFAYTPDPYAYAPEDAVIDSYINAGACGNNLQFTGATGRHGFCHLDEIYVSVGQRVQKGQRLAKMGNSGQSYGAHLHWVLKINGQYVNPMDYVNKDIDMVTPEEVDIAFQAGFNRRAAEDEVKALTGKPTKELLNHVLKYNQDFRTKGSEYDNVNAALQEAYKEIDQLRAELAVQSEDSIQLNTLGSALRWVIARLGLKN